MFIQRSCDEGLKNLKILNFFIFIWKFSLLMIYNYKNKIKKLKVTSASVLYKNFGASVLKKSLEVSK